MRRLNFQGKQTTINQLVTSDELIERRQRLASILTVGDPELQEALLEYHHLFSLGEEERGETQLRRSLTD